MMSLQISAQKCAAFARECGLSWPVSNRGRWLRDPHLLLAAGAAIPVWAVLAAGFGPFMYHPADFFGWLAFVVLQPTIEELAFRGLLQGQLLRLTQKRQMAGVSMANVLTTVVFVVMHLPSQHPGWALAAGVPSLVLGHLRERQVSVIPAMALHMIYNGGFAMVAWWGHRLL